MTLERLKHGLTALTLLASIGAAGCGSDAAPGGGLPTATAGGPGPGFTPPPAAAAAGSNAVIPTGAAGSQAIKPAPTTTPVMAPTMTATMPPGAVNVPGVPCDVAAVVSESCTTCHASPVKFQAPMPLMAHADFMAPAKTDPAKKVFQVIPPRINSSDVKLRMPPATGTQINTANLKVFNDWLAAGAQAVTPSCAITVKGSETTPVMMPTAGGGAVPPTTGKPASVTMGGAHSEKIEYDDPMMKCYEFRAHAAGNKTQAYSVSTQPDMYTNFMFTAPWQGMMYARSYRILDGNAEVIHHWLLYKNALPGTESITPSIGAHPDGELVHGWAPGGSHLYMDFDVGVEMPGSVAYTLETHHNNKTGKAQPDNSGVEVCVTPMVPKNVASLSWLGTDSIGGTTATGTCTPLSTGPIHILGFSPHMHTKGKHMRAQITRSNGMKEMMHDEPFDFAFQHSYNANFTIMPGDSITTTCSFTAPAAFGEGTNDEMCYLFTLYYPKLSLTNGNPIATLIHGPNTCLQ